MVIDHGGTLGLRGRVVFFKKEKRTTFNCIPKSVCIVLSIFNKQSRSFTFGSKMSLLVSSLVTSIAIA